MKKKGTWMRASAGSPFCGNGIGVCNCSAGCKGRKCGRESGL